MADVLIPVPEEFVAEFSRQMLSYVVSAQMSSHEVDEVSRIRAGLPSEDRAMFDLVCLASARREFLSVEAIATTLGLVTGDVFRIAAEINGAFQLENLNPVLITEGRMRSDESGSTLFEHLVYLVPTLAARLISLGPTPDDQPA